MTLEKLKEIEDTEKLREVVFKQDKYVLKEILSELEKIKEKYKIWSIKEVIIFVLCKTKLLEMEDKDIKKCFVKGE